MWICFLCFHVRVDSVSSSPDGVKSRELGSAAAYDVLPCSYPEQPAEPRDAHAPADDHQEEGEDAFLSKHGWYDRWKR